MLRTKTLARLPDIHAKCFGGFLALGYRHVALGAIDAKHIGAQSLDRFRDRRRSRHR